MVTVSMVRTGAPTAVNTDTAMATVDDSTSAPNDKVPTTFDGNDMTGKVVYLGAVEVVGASDGAVVGAAVLAVRLESLGSELQRFVGGVQGGQNATGEETVLQPAFYRTKVACTAGKEWISKCQMLGTDTGSAVVTVTLHFTDTDPWEAVKQTLTDYRVGQATATAAGVLMQTRDQSTSDGGFAISAGYTRCASIQTGGASTTSAVGSCTANLTLKDNGVKQTQRFGVSAAGGTLATSGNHGMAMFEHYGATFAVVANQVANPYAFMNTTDVGAYTIAVALTLVQE